MGSRYICCFVNEVEYILDELSINLVINNEDIESDENELDFVNVFVFFLCRWGIWIFFKLEFNLIVMIVDRSNFFLGFLIKFYFVFWR